jgi:hypothetical protein
MARGKRRALPFPDALRRWRLTNALTDAGFIPRILDVSVRVSSSRPSASATLGFPFRRKSASQALTRDADISAVNVNAQPCTRSSSRDTTISVYRGVLPRASNSRRKIREMFNHRPLTVRFERIGNAHLAQLDLVDHSGQHLLRGHLVRGKWNGLRIAGNPSVPLRTLTLYRVAQAGAGRLSASANASARPPRPRGDLTFSVPSMTSKRKSSNGRPSRSFLLAT